MNPALRTVADSTSCSFLCHNEQHVKLKATLPIYRKVFGKNYKSPDCFQQLLIDLG